jgi:hypothetical protein
MGVSQEHIQDKSGIKHKSEKVKKKQPYFSRKFL